MLEKLRLTRYCAHLCFRAHGGAVIDRSASPKIPLRSCHPVSGGGRSPSHPPTMTTPALENLTVPPTMLLQLKRRLTPESGTLSVKNITKVLSILSIVLATDETSSGTTAPYIATRIHSHPRAGRSSTMRVFPHQNGFMLALTNGQPTTPLWSTTYVNTSEPVPTIAAMDGNQWRLGPPLRRVQRG